MKDPSTSWSASGCSSTLAAVICRSISNRCIACSRRAGYSSIMASRFAPSANASPVVFWRLRPVAAGHSEPLRVRSWYGLPAELGVEDRLWHLVKVGGGSLSPPPVVNTFLRAGLPEAERLRLSYLHEFGHLQTFPLALAHAAALLWAGLRQGRSLAGWIGWILAVLLAHEATWELASESYVVLGDRAAYRQA